MQEMISKILGSHEATILTIVLVVIGTNVMMTALKKSLGWVKDKTETKLDDKAYAIVEKVLSATDKVLEFASANSTALPEKAKAELEKKEWKESEPKV
jgi:hypothetical protein